MAHESLFRLSYGGIFYAFHFGGLRDSSDCGLLFKSDSMTPLEIKYIEKLKEINGLLRGPRYYEVWMKVLKLESEVAELGKQCQFELLCDPDIFEASANEHLEQQIKEEEKPDPDDEFVKSYLPAEMVDKEWIFEIMNKTNVFAKQLIEDHFNRHK